MADHARTEQQCPLHRFAAGNLDKIILQQLTRIFKTPSMMVNLYNELWRREKLKCQELQKRQSELESNLQKIRKAIHSGGDIIELRQQFTTIENELTTVKTELKNLGEVYSTHELLETCDSLEAIWEELFPAERYKLAHLLIDQITFYKDKIVTDIKHHGLKSLIRDLKSEPEFTATAPAAPDTIQLTIPVLVKRWNGRKLIIAPGEPENDEPENDEFNAVAKKLAQAYRFMAMIETGKYSTRTRLAEELNLDPSIVAKTFSLLNLSPKIQKMIVENKMPDGMTLERLYGNIPVEWEEQEKVFLPQLV